jgi:hypothetical protein
MVARRMDVIITTETTMRIRILAMLYAMNVAYVGKLVTAVLLGGHLCMATNWMAFFLLVSEQ